MLKKGMILDYEQILTSTLMELGGVECLSRFKTALKTKALRDTEVEQVNITPSEFSLSRRESYVRTSDRLRSILIAGKISNPIYKQYIALRCSGVSESKIKELIGAKVGSPGFVSNLLKHEGRKLRV